MANTPNVRFKGFADDWEQRKLGDISEKVTMKNSGTKYVETLTNSAEFGIISQRDFFDHDVSNMENIDGYYVVEDDAFVYNPRISTSAPVGPINRNKLGRTGVMSPLYTVFKTHDIDSEYLEWFFKSSCWYSFMYFNGDTGARSDRFSIKDAVFFEMPIPIPDIGEQNKIGKYLTQLDSLISLHQRKCGEVRQFKKFMLKKMFPKSGELIPEIRFAGFTDDWEQRKLGEVLTSLQNNTLSRAELSTESGIAKNVHYGDILVKFGEVLDVRTELLPMITDEGIVAKYKASFLQDGDVIVADTAEDETVGKCSEMVGLSGETVIAGLHTIPYRPLFHFALGYLGYFMNSTAYHQQLLPLMQGIKVTSISKSAMQNTSIVYPKSEEEQAKIGAYFRNLDHLITLHQRKCDELKEVKRFMLQNMFPQKG